MKRIAFGSLLAAAFLGPFPAVAQLATTQFYNLVNTPATVTYNAGGSAQIRLTPTASIISITGYRRVSVRIGATHATKMIVSIGKISGTTLSQFVYNGPIDGLIHTFEVTGPELVISLTGGAPGTTEQVQVWVYLTT